MMNIPSSTYRVQFSPSFTFDHLYNLVDYLSDLGITCIYASPILQPTYGSEHGYDGIDCSRLNPQLGNIDSLERLSRKLKEKNIGWIQDIVPNHMAFHTSNLWLRDVLERGMNSTFAKYFDIDWEHPAYLHKLMVPFLDEELQDCLEKNKVRIEFSKENGFYFAYYDNKYPVNAESYSRLLSGSFREENNEVNAALGALVNNAATDHAHWLALKEDLLQLFTDELIRGIEEQLRSFNEDKRFLLEIAYAQHYVLCHFTESHLRINYRRFFNVNGLICLRIEDQQVFNDYHSYIHNLAEKGIIQGLRIDHIDGLKNPHEYIHRLRALFGKDCFIIVEKILDVKEELPADWKIQGTSGYEFLSFINQVLTDNKGSEKLLALYRQYVPTNGNYRDLVFANKLSNFETYLNGEWDNLLRYLLSLNLIDDAEIRLPDLKLALGVFMACFPVYRVYIEEIPVKINDEVLIVMAFAEAWQRYPQLNYELGILRQLFIPHPDLNRTNNRFLFIQRLMQFTGPLAAKGIEDTTFYQYNPLISHNEVGDQPARLGITAREFHEKMQQRLLINNLSFNCTSTHDTKRGEDGRIRINIISELSDEWAELVAHWQKINEPYHTMVNDIKAPLINDEYFLYQAIVGSFPEDLVVTESFTSRTKKYYVKVLRESKNMSNHIEPNIAYEEACQQFIDHLLNPDHAFLPSLLPFMKRIILYANTYSMVQVVIKTTAPGIPDIYQGCELWDLSYVDPDNRRPVNFGLRKQLLSELKEKEADGADALLEWAHSKYETGTQKLLVTHKMLQLRKQYTPLFTTGEYIPVYAEGSDRDVITYIRKCEDKWILVVLPMGIVGNRKLDLHLVLPEGAPEKWRNIITDEMINSDELDVKIVFKKFPVAVLENI